MVRYLIELGFYFFCTLPRIIWGKLHGNLVRVHWGRHLNNFGDCLTPDILKYYQKYKVCAVPQKTVHAEHREMLQKIKDKDKDGMKELVLRHLSNLIDFAKLSAKGDIPEFEYGHI